MLNSTKILQLFPSAILLFWAMWFSLVSISDFTNLLQKFQIISEDFIFTSKNYDLISQSLLTYKIISQKLTIILFSIIVIWAVTIAGSFWVALLGPKALKLNMAYFSFLASLCMSGSFMLWDEIFLQYNFEHSLMIRFGFQILTFMLFLMLNNKIKI